MREETSDETESKIDETESISDEQEAHEEKDILKTAMEASSIDDENLFPPESPNVQDDHIVLEKPVRSSSPINPTSQMISESPLKVGIPVFGNNSVDVEDPNTPIVKSDKEGILLFDLLVQKATSHIPSADEEFTNKEKLTSIVEPLNNSNFIDTEQSTNEEESLREDTPTREVVDNYQEIPPKNPAEDVQDEEEEVKKQEKQDK